MKRSGLLFYFLFFALPFSLFSQYREAELFIPDSFSGFYFATQMVWDSIRDRLYIHGTISDRILVLDCGRDEKLPPIEVVRGRYSCCEGIFYNPLNNCLYAAYQHPKNIIAIIDCATRRLVREIPLPFEAWGYAAFDLNPRENKVYLSIGRTELDTTFFVIDGATHEVLYKTKIWSGWWKLERSPFLWNPINNKIYYFLTASSRNKIYILDGATGRIEDSISPTRFLLPDIIMNERCDRIYIPAGDSFPNPHEFFLLIFDCERNQIIGEVSLGPYLCPAGALVEYNQTNNKLYLMCGGLERDDRVKVVDLTTLQVDIIPFQMGLTSIKYISRHNVLYCFVNYDSSVVIIDGATNQIIGYIRIPSNADSYVGRPCFYHPLRDKVYFVNQLLGIIDCQSQEHIKEIYLGVSQGGPYDLILNPLTRKLYATDPSFPIVSVFDVQRNRSLGYANFRDYVGPRGIGYGGVSTRMNKVYLSCGGGPIIVLDGNTDSLLTVITGIPTFRRLLYLDGLNKIFAYPPPAPTGDPYTYVIDCSTDMVIDQIFTGYRTFSISYSPATNKVYMGVSGGERGRTRVIDGVTHQVIKVFENIQGDIGYDPRNERIYISDGLPTCDLFQARRIEPMRVDTARLFRGLFIIDGFQDSIIRYIRGAHGLFLALDTIDNRIYLATYESEDTIKIFDLESNRVIGRIESSIIVGLFWNPINNKLYYGLFGIKALDCRTNKIIWEYPQGYSENIELDTKVWYPELNRLYVKVYEKSKLLVIRDEIPGIEEGAFGQRREIFKVFPTVGNYFSISWWGREKGEVIVYNPLGRKVKEFNLESGEKVIWNGKEEGLSSGVYLLIVRSGEKESIVREKVIYK
ncbi:MAG: hypothetical protein ABIK99_04625 [candidate division WOR-3 bacterium]